MPPHRIRQAIDRGAAFLERNGTACPETDSEWLLAHVRETDRSTLRLQPEIELTATENAQFQALLDRRATGEPLQYIIGVAGFFNSDILVGPGVLVPRPETERLVEIALAQYPGHGDILDICTGSANILIALAGELDPVPALTGTDISPDALSWAERNVGTVAEAKIELLCGDLLAPVAGRQFAMITANPPYVSPSEFTALPSTVHDFEPRAALFAEDNGLAFIKRLAAEAPACLNVSGAFLCEIGAAQAAASAAIFNTPAWTNVQIHQDYTGRDRIITARKSDSA